jgi:hypothetical protein
MEHENQDDSEERELWGDDFWDDRAEGPQAKRDELVKKSIHRMLREMELKAKQRLNYLELEGFVQKTETPGVYEYTPEGLVAIREQYRKILED